MTGAPDGPPGPGAGKAPPELSDREKRRYSRHILLPQVGLEGQRKLKAARVLVVGTGGLGAPLSLYLAAAGVGLVGLLDFDLVEDSNLQRQIVFGSRDVGRPKTAAARDRLLGLNPDVEIKTHQVRLEAKNAEKIISGYDIVCDGADNFPTRYLVNDVCVFQKKPVVHASIYQFEGQATVFGAPGGPCYRCLYPAPPPPGLAPSCGEGGVVGVLPGILGSLQASEAVKLIVGGAETLAGRLLLFDAWTARFTEVAVDKDPACPVCGGNPVVTEPVDYEGFCGLGGGLEEAGAEPIGADELRHRLEHGPAPQVVDIREPHERALYAFPGSTPVPFGQLVRRMGEFDPARDLVFICKVGRRSVFAIRSLRKAGYQGRAFNLTGGVDDWARVVGGPPVPY
ncbi:MAG: molybdopterin-synthase adenylyltransferase MoeB [Deltaproteobacteria bacterium]|jgi:adenylyltransferase/sulfurtransferase|nr:molybdopterin-synthase adenylyltransferase MoeB [Deltaproteobacteria bacterium]